MKGEGWRIRVHEDTTLSCARHARGAFMRTRQKNLKIQSSRGLGGYTKFFSTKNLIFFVTINSVQNFKTVAQPLLGEKFLWWWVVVVGV